MAPSGWSICRMISSVTKWGTATVSTKVKRQNFFSLISFQLMNSASSIPKM